MSNARFHTSYNTKTNEIKRDLFLAAYEIEMELTLCLHQHQIVRNLEANGIWLKMENEMNF